MREKMFHRMNRSASASLALGRISAFAGAFMGEYYAFFHPCSRAGIVQRET